MAETLLEADALRKTYHRMVALEQLSLTVAAGEVVGLLGPNGAGKTTALRMLAGILTPTAGSARICGFDTRTETLEARRRLGFLSGDTALYRRLTPREVLRYFGALHEVDAATIEARTEALVQELDMSDFADRFCGQLSAGQQQKANIARTLIHDPPVLILDEPTTSLDIITGRFILEAIQRARAAGKAVLFSTHIMAEAEYLCDRMALIYQGQIRACGTLAELRQQANRDSLAEVFLTLAL